MFLCCATNNRIDREMKKTLTGRGSGGRSGSMRPSADEMPSYKVVVLGDGGVGKSALTIQYFQKTFIEEYDPTIEDSYIQTMEIDGQWCIMDVLDTAGQEEYSAMRDQYIRKGDGFLLVYSVVDVQSYLNVKHIYDQIIRVKDRETCPILLVANKIDLADMRAVTEEMGRRLSREINVPYIETSCKPPPVNVNLTFTEIIREIRAQPDEFNDAEKRRKNGRGKKAKGKECGKSSCTIL